MSRIRMTKEERKQQIQAAAKKVFLEKGFKNTVMDDIMREANLSRGGLYHHYKSTNEILYDIMDEGNKEREIVIKKTMKSRSELSCNKLVAKIIVDKMLAENDSIEIYAMFLQEIKEDSILKNLYKKLKNKSTQGILTLLKQNHLEEGLISSLNLITDLINSVILSCEILDIRDNLIKNRNVLEKIIASVLEGENQEK